MSENVILAGLRKVSDEIRNLSGIILTNTTALKGMSDSVLGKISKQVYTMKELALRWNCSERYAREIVERFKIPLVLGKSNRPRQPHCVFESDLIKYEQQETERKLNNSEFSISPPIGKSARNFVPYKRRNSIIFKKGARLGDIKK